MTSSETATAELVRAIVKAVPEISYSQCEKCSYYWYDERRTCTRCGEYVKTHLASRPITLEDVLRACPKSKPRLVVSIQGEFLIVSPDVTDTWYSSNKFPKWSLGKPLSEQSDELKSFLHSLLV
ncbi:MAG: hypothetical protein JWP89_2589 [Schlesneria sp.]|nr:hypothetical protein [Schlesneria sp.]